MMLDADIVAVSPSSVYRVLKAAGKLAPRAGEAVQEGARLRAAAAAPRALARRRLLHQHLRDILLPVQHPRRLQPVVVHWEIRETMKEAEVETIIQRARESFPGERPRIISDNGPQFIAKDFKALIRYI